MFLMSYGFIFIGIGVIFIAQKKIELTMAQLVVKYQNRLDIDVTSLKFERLQIRTQQSHPHMMNEFTFNFHYNRGDIHCTSGAHACTQFFEFTTVQLVKYQNR